MLVYVVMIQCNIACPQGVKLRDKYWTLLKVLPTHSTAKKKATHSRHFIFSCPSHCFRLHSSDIHHRHHLSSFFAQRKYPTIAAQYRAIREFLLSYTSFSCRVLLTPLWEISCKKIITSWPNVMKRVTKTHPTEDNRLVLVIITKLLSS